MSKGSLSKMKKLFYWHISAIFLTGIFLFDLLLFLSGRNTYLFPSKKIVVDFEIFFAVGWTIYLLLKTIEWINIRNWKNVIFIIIALIIVIGLYKISTNYLVEKSVTEAKEKFQFFLKNPSTQQNNIRVEEKTSETYRQFIKSPKPKRCNMVMHVPHLRTYEFECIPYAHPSFRIRLTTSQFEKDKIWVH